MKNILLPAAIAFLLLLSACGSRKSPTGGPEDTEKPMVLASLPAQFGQIENGRIEINFSKPLDKSSVSQAVYIYPPVADKKISLDNSTLTIQINEKLIPDTNYYVTLTTRLKDLRGNALEGNQTLVFANGNLNGHRLSGEIGYEDRSDSGNSVQLSLLSADSLMVMQTTLAGSTYSLEALNPADYILRAFIDKDRNGRYDLSREPWYEGRFSLTGNRSQDLYLAYADTTLPRIAMAQAVSQREIVLDLSEPVADYSSLRITRMDNQEELPVLITQLRGTKLTLLTEIQDAFAYNVEIKGLKDNKGNVQPSSKSEFRAALSPDTVSPQILGSNPRNGTSVDSLKPVLEISFSEIIPRGKVSALLRATETSTEYALDILKSDSDVYRFQPRANLQNYRSYVLIVDAQDISGNKMQQSYRLNFLPLLRTE